MGPSGGIPWPRPFSILLGGSAVLTNLGVCASPSPSHPPWKTPLPGDVWLNFGFSILQNAPHQKSRKTHSYPSDLSHHETADLPRTPNSPPVAFWGCVGYRGECFVKNHFSRRQKYVQYYPSPAEVHPPIADVFWWQPRRQIQCVAVQFQFPFGPEEWRRERTRRLLLKRFTRLIEKM